jgi:uncharacterized protein YgbK (DUF1537 family)
LSLSGQQTAEAIASALGEICRQIALKVTLSGLVLTGGDTAAAVCHRLGASLIELHGEPVPGIASGALLDGAHPGLPLITKAGAFECDLKLIIEELN